MARKIIWSANAKNDRTAILKYWIARNKSNTHSKKLTFYSSKPPVLFQKIQGLVISLLKKMLK